MIETEKLGLHDFVRNILPAGTAVLVVGLAYPTVTTTAWKALSGPQTALLALLLPAFGFAIYSLHRGLFHPMLLRVVLLAIWVCRRRTESSGFLNPFIPSELERKLLEKWRSDKPESLHRWASRVHSLYCSAWAIGAVSAFAPCFLGPPEHPGWFPWLFGIALAVGILEDIRLNHTVIVAEIESPVAPRKG